VLPVVARTGGSPTNRAANVQELPASDVSTPALEAARQDKRLADQNLEKRPELAYAFCENALALSRLVRRESSAEQSGKSLVQTLERCRHRLEQTTRACAGCNGTGRRTVHFQNLGGAKNGSALGGTSQVVEGPVCDECNGQKEVAVARSANELRVAIAQGRRDFETRQQAAGRVACGRVWVPPQILERLDVRAQALLRTACPTPCAACMGLGVQDCAKCRGAARVKCTQSGCTDGWVLRKESNVLLGKGAVQRKERCPSCQGTGFAPCTECRGVGTAPCRACNGTGRGASCEGCGGQGWALCAKCQGNGVVSGAVCPVCRGSNETLCPKCRGDGCAGK
jgi:DnaJ-class molecular chaperone